MISTCWSLYCICNFLVAFLIMGCYNNILSSLNSRCEFLMLLDRYWVIRPSQFLKIRALWFVHCALTSSLADAGSTISLSSSLKAISLSHDIHLVMIIRIFTRVSCIQVKCLNSCFVSKPKFNNCYLVGHSQTGWTWPEGHCVPVEIGPESKNIETTSCGVENPDVYTSHPRDSLSPQCLRGAFLPRQTLTVFWEKAGLAW